MFSVMKKRHLYGSEEIIILYVWLASIATLALCSSLRMIGGRDVKENELPYVVRLEYVIIKTKNNINKIRYQFLCTGSTLSPKWTLTAGHCLHEDDPHDPLKNYKKVVGYGTPTGKPKGSKRSNILEEFNRFENYKEEDIALVKTDPITIEKYGKLSALDYVSLLYQEVTVAGYGDTNYTNPDTLNVELNAAPDLQKPLQVIEMLLTRCVDVEYPFDRARADFPYLCMVKKCSGQTSICGGDSGGPIIHSTGIIGVTARAPMDYNCQMKSDLFRKPNAGDVFLVSPYVDWVYSVVNK